MKYCVRGPVTRCRDDRAILPAGLYPPDPCGSGADHSFYLPLPASYLLLVSLLFVFGFVMEPELLVSGDAFEPVVLC